MTVLKRILSSASFQIYQSSFLVQLSWKKCDMEILMLYIYLECLWMLAYVSFFLVYTITSITSFYTWIWFSCCPCFGYLVEKWVPGFQQKNSVPRSCSFRTFTLSLFSYVNFCLVMISSWLDIVHWTFDVFGYCMWFLCMIVVLKKK